jgi:hypothetical protein
MNSHRDLITMISKLSVGDLCGSEFVQFALNPSTLVMIGRTMEQAHFNRLFAPSTGYLSHRRDIHIW